MNTTKAFAPILLGVAAGAAIVMATACSQPATANRFALAAGQSAGSVIATVGERAITTAEVDAMIGNKLLRVRLEEYTQRRQVLQEVIASALLEEEAARRGVTAKDLLEQEVENKAPPVTEEEAAAVYESAPDRFRTLSPADALRSITESLRRVRVNQRRQAFTKELERAANVRVLLEPPRVAVDPSDDPSRGPADAPVTIVEFSRLRATPPAGTAMRTAIAHRSSTATVVSRVMRPLGSTPASSNSTPGKTRRTSGSSIATRPGSGLSGILAPGMKTDSSSAVFPLRFFGSVRRRVPAATRTDPSTAVAGTLTGAEVGHCVGGETEAMVFRRRFGAFRGALMRATASAQRSVYCREGRWAWGARSPHRLDGTHAFVAASARLLRWLLR